MVAPQSINSATWRTYLQGLYDTRKDRRSAFAVVLVLEQQVASMTALRAKFGDHSTTHALVQWDKDFASLAERVRLYREDVPCADVPDATCGFGLTGWTGTPAQQANRYAYEWAARPILEGKWPEDYYMGQGHPARPDAVEAAALWNQLIAVEELHHELTSLWGGHLAAGWPAGEWLLEVEREMSLSAPGEEPTIADWLAKGQQNAVEFFKAAGSALIWGAGIAGGLFTGWLLWKAFSK